jgi:hypothetical protein
VVNIDNDSDDDDNEIRDYLKDEEVRIFYNTFVTSNALYRS